VQVLARAWLSTALVACSASSASGTLLDAGLDAAVGSDAAGDGGTAASKPCTGPCFDAIRETEQPCPQTGSCQEETVGDASLQCFSNGTVTTTTSGNAIFGDFTVRNDAGPCYSLALGSALNLYGPDGSLVVSIGQVDGSVTTSVVTCGTTQTEFDMSDPTCSPFFSVGADAAPSCTPGTCTP
jgi:hypothetical protein